MRIRRKIHIRRDLFLIFDQPVFDNLFLFRFWLFRLHFRRDCSYLFKELSFSLIVMSFLLIHIIKNSFDDSFTCLRNIVFSFKLHFSLSFMILFNLRFNIAHPDHVMCQRWPCMRNIHKKVLHKSIRLCSKRLKKLRE